ncbi:hypothetical protein Q1695_015523 [Nippostrongylus brasiliensis]|nr:hypothetical protein Q1695_015523 [Nippostrongylus brasiliensis]
MNTDAEDSRYRHVEKKEAREELLRKNHQVTSPLPRIPKRIEFASSTAVAPEIVSIEKKKLRARVRVADEILEHFESCAMGMYVGQEEKVAHFEKLPLVASGLAAVPVLDEGLRVTSFRLGIDEHTMVIEEEAILNALNLLAIGRNEAREGRMEKMDMYARQAMELLGIVVHDLNVRRRERFFRSFGVDPCKSEPNYRGLPIELHTRSADKPWNEFAPALIGSRLSSEVVDKTQCQKLTAALVKEKKITKGERNNNSKPKKPGKRLEPRSASSNLTKRTSHRPHQSKLAKEDERRATETKRASRTQKKNNRS